MRKFIILNLFALSVLIIFLASCDGFFGGCGAFGYSSSYRSKLVIDNSFKSIAIAKGDSIILLPERHLHIDYTYTGNPDCNKSDYTSSPDKIMAEIENDSLALAEVYTEGVVTIWGGNEEKILIKGQNTGDTFLSLRVEWPVEGNDLIHRLDTTFTIALRVF